MSFILNYLDEALDSVTGRYEGQEEELEREDSDDARGAHKDEREKCPPGAIGQASNTGEVRLIQSNNAACFVCRGEF